MNPKSLVVAPHAADSRSLIVKCELYASFDTDCLSLYVVLELEKFVLVFVLVCFLRDAGAFGTNDIPKNDLTVYSMCIFILSTNAAKIAACQTTDG